VGPSAHGTAVPQPQLLPDAPQRRERRGDVLVEVHAQLGGAVHDVLARGSTNVAR
jgi:hypothetical protein